MKEYTIRVAHRGINNYSGYSSLITVLDQNTMAKTGRCKPMKYTLEEAREEAKKKLHAGSDDKNFVYPYCKIYKGRECIETIEA